MGTTIEEINERIKRGEAVVVTAEEVMDLSLIHISEPTRPY
mgnify:CR=1 FL=1